MYTVDQVAKLLGVNKETVRRWIRSGKLEAHLSGSKKGGYLITQRALDVFQASRGKEGAMDMDTIAMMEKIECEIDPSAYKEFFNEHAEEIVDKIAAKAAAYIISKL